MKKLFYIFLILAALSLNAETDFIYFDISASSLNAQGVFPPEFMSALTNSLTLSLESEYGYNFSPFFTLEPKGKKLVANNVPFKASVKKGCVFEYAAKNSDIGLFLTSGDQKVPIKKGKLRVLGVLPADVNLAMYEGACAVSFWPDNLSEISEEQLYYKKANLVADYKEDFYLAKIKVTPKGKYKVKIQVLFFPYGLMFESSEIN